MARTKTEIIEAVIDAAMIAGRDRIKIKSVELCADEYDCVYQHPFPPLGCFAKIDGPEGTITVTRGAGISKRDLQKQALKDKLAAVQAAIEELCG